ncbi:reverse transcriptase [Senna tora]|uniref:Reverse transcriptase n=1 Tax=Senna tora TaxID=362788 RepID=A0A834TFL4_9FABA|nr:reverse transcriptase [Senna tora]
MGCDPPTSVSVNHTIVWKTIWNLKLLYRIMMFMWRALNDNLPVSSVLDKHHMQMDDICSTCGNCGESLLHIFLNCCYAKAVWFGTHVGFRSQALVISSLFDWFVECITYFQGEDQYLISFIAMVLHVIWRCHNLCVMEGKYLDPSAAISMIYAFWHTYKAAYSTHPNIQNTVLHTSKHDKWKTADTMPTSSISVIIAVRKCKSRLCTWSAYSDLSAMALTTACCYQFHSWRPRNCFEQAEQEDNYEVIEIEEGEEVEGHS